MRAVYISALWGQRSAVEKDGVMDWQKTAVEAQYLTAVGVKEQEKQETFRRHYKALMHSLTL